MARKTYYAGSGKRLSMVRKQIGISRKDMAGRLGLSPSAYYKNETGETFPRPSIVVRLEKEYGVSMDWFMFGKGEMFYGKERERVQELERELGALKEQLEAAQESLSVKEKGLELKGFGVERKVEVKELMEHMSRITLLYHEVMVHFQRFKMENRDLVDISMAAPKP